MDIRPGSLAYRILETAVGMAVSGKPDWYGYELTYAMTGGPEAVALLGHGSVYKALRRLEADGFLRSRWEKAADLPDKARPRRKYYAVTAEGKTALRRADAVMAGPSLSQVVG